MDWEFFESLSETDARKFLENFLAVGSKKVPLLVSAAERDGVQADFTIDSIVPVFQWGISRLTTVPKEPDDTLPDWIRETPSYLENLFEFDEQSKTLLLRMAYYLGETFVRSFPSLSWDIGNREYAQQNMPVIVGFDKNIELAPLLVTENTCGSLKAGPAQQEDIDVMVKAWTELVRS